MEGNIEVESVSSGFRYTAESGMHSFTDQNGERGHTSPDEIRGGWASSEAEARELAEEALADIEE